MTRRLQLELAIILALGLGTLCLELTVWAPASVMDIASDVLVFAVLAVVAVRRDRRQRVRGAADGREQESPPVIP